MKKRLFFLLLVLAMVFTQAAPALGSNGDNTAATVYLNGIVYTVEGDDWDQSPQQSVAIGKDGKILFVGDDAGAAAFIGGGTRVVDLYGKTVLPGFVDTHVHAPGNARPILFGNSIFIMIPHSVASIERDVRAFVERNPNFRSYSGGRFSMGSLAMPTGPDHVNYGFYGYGSPRLMLDAISPDKPIRITSTDGHNTWQNSAAFALNGITAETIPSAGVLHVYNGELWGTLSGAVPLGTMPSNAGLARPITEEEELIAMAFFQELMLGWGHTSMNVNSGMAVAERMIELEKRGEWFMRANFMYSFSNPSNASNFASNLNGYRSNKASFEERSKLVRITTAKFFMDNTVEGGTAYLSKPYANAEDLGRGSDWRGSPRQNMDVWPGFLTQLMAEGIQIHVHAIGDAAIHNTLNAMETAQKNNPGVNTRNTITHLHVVDEADIPRFGELGIIASTQPYWHLKEPAWYDDMEVAFLGVERAWKGYPVKSFIDTGARVTFSGDYNVTDPNFPFNAIEVATTRNLFDGDFYFIPDITDIDDPTYLRNPAERITVAQAIEAYTINGAYQLFMEDAIGSLAVGKWADMIIIDQDVVSFKGNKLLDINKTQILATIVAGKPVLGIMNDEIAPVITNIVTTDLATMDMSVEVTATDAGSGVASYTFYQWDAVAGTYVLKGKQADGTFTYQALSSADNYRLMVVVKDHAGNETAQVITPFTAVSYVTETGPGDLEVNTGLFNNQRAAQTCTVVLAVYDKAGRMVECKPTTTTVPANTSQTVVSDLSEIEFGEGRTAKLFVWCDRFMPLAEAYGVALK